MSVAEQIKEVATCIKNAVPDAIMKIKCVHKLLDDIEKNVSFKCHEDPRVASEIEELKQVFRKVIIHSDRYVVACRNLAKYSSNTRHIQSIKVDLEGGSVQKLKRYLYDVSDRIAICCRCLDEYTTMFKKLQEDANSVQKKQISKVEEKQKGVKLMQRVSSGTGIAAGTTGTVAGISGAVGTAAFVVSAVVPPTAVVGVPVGITSMVITGALIASATASAGTAVGFTIAKSISTQELQLLVKTTESLADLQKKMDKNKCEMLRLELCVRNISECVEGSTVTIEYDNGTERQIKGLKHHANDPNHYDDGELESLWDIEDKLDLMQAEMEKLLKIIDDESAE